MPFGHESNDDSGNGTNEPWPSDRIHPADCLSHILDTSRRVLPEPHGVVTPSALAPCSEEADDNEGQGSAARDSYSHAEDNPWPKPDASRAGVNASTRPRPEGAGARHSRRGETLVPEFQLQISSDQHESQKPEERRQADGQHSAPGSPQPRAGHRRMISRGSGQFCGAVNGCGLLDSDWRFADVNPPGDRGSRQSPLGRRR